MFRRQLQTKIRKNRKKNKTNKIKDLAKIIGINGNGFNYFNGIKNIGDFDLTKYCKKNYEIIIKYFRNEFQKINNLHNLNEYRNYLIQEWNKFLNIDILLNDLLEKEILLKEILEKEILLKEILEKETQKKKQKELTLISYEKHIKKCKDKNELEERQYDQYLIELKTLELEKERQYQQYIQKGKSNTFQIFGKSDKSLLWLINNSTIKEINDLLKNDKINQQQYNYILENR